LSRIEGAKAALGENLVGRDFQVRLSDEKRYYNPVFDVALRLKNWVGMVDVHKASFHIVTFRGHHASIRMGETREAGADPRLNRRNAAVNPTLPP